jgi:26S proteasome regulatory subunit N1
MTYSDTQPRGTLRYRLLSASLLPASSKLTEPGSWGHEYVRHLAAELGEEYTFRTEGEGIEQPAPTSDDAPKDTNEKTPQPKPVEVVGTVDDLRNLAVECAKFLLAHNAEPDAVDLLEELEIVSKIAELVDDNTYVRVTQYMVRSVTALHLDNFSLRMIKQLCQPPPVAARRCCIFAYSPYNLYATSQVPRGTCSRHSVG